MNKKGIILLSGGLDSLVSLDIARKKYDIKLSLTFNYGQKAFKEEYIAAQEISNYYNIQNKLIELPFLNEILDNALVKNEITNLNDFNQLWIPNRNGLFLNIAACYCDKFNYDVIIFGANKEEAKKFSDNSKKFIKSINQTFKFSTQKQPIIEAPCLKFDKNKIIKYAIDNTLPLNLIKSCYDSYNNTGKKHCGKCMSCLLLKNAIIKNKNEKLLKEIF